MLAEYSVTELFSQVILLSRLFSQKIAVSKEYPVFNTVGLCSDFLLHLVNDGGDFKRFALMQKKGGTRTRLYFNTLCSWKPLLPSHREQQKVADCLSSIDELDHRGSPEAGGPQGSQEGPDGSLSPPKAKPCPACASPSFGMRESGCRTILALKQQRLGAESRQRVEKRLIRSQVGHLSEAKTSAGVSYYLTMWHS